MTKDNESGQHEQVCFTKGDVIFPLPTYVTRLRPGALADNADAAAKRATAAIDDALNFVAPSMARINDIEKAKREKS